MYLIYLTTSHPDASYKVTNQLTFRFRRRSEKQIFKMTTMIGIILAISALPGTPMHRTKFRVNWPFGSGEEAENRFSRWRPCWQSWISDRNDFSFFNLHVTLMFPTKFHASWPFGSGEEAKIYFYDSGHGSYIGIPIVKDLDSFDFQVTPMLPTKFQINCPFGSGEKANKDFHPDASCQVSS